MKAKDFMNYSGEDRVIDSYEMRSSFKQQQHLFKVKSRIPALDKVIEGFVPGELVVVSGYTKNGKTLLCQTLTNNFVKDNIQSLWFTFELPPQQFLSCFPDMPLIYMPAILKHSNLNWVEDRIIESFQKYHTRTIFIDHLHYIVDIARKGNASIDIGEVIRRLKSLAVANNFIIFVLCHTRNDERNAEDFGSPRDSSFIEQESDTALMVKRFPVIGENIAAVQVNQHRRTGVMKKRVWVEKIGSYLVETVEREIPKEKEKKNGGRKYWDN